MSNWVGSLPLPPKKPDNERSTRKTIPNASSKSGYRSPPKERKAIGNDGKNDPPRKSQALQSPKPPPPPQPLPPRAVTVQVPKKEPEVAKPVTPPPPPPRPPTPPPTSPPTPPPSLPPTTPPSPPSLVKPKRKVKKKPAPVKQKEPPPAAVVTHTQTENFDIEPTEKKPEDSRPLKINPITKNLKLFQISFIPKSEGEYDSGLASIGAAKAKSVEEQNKVAAADQELLEAPAIEQGDPFNIPDQRICPGTSVNRYKNFGKFIDVLHLGGSDSESVSSWGSG